jgi:hypothetical protein
MSGMVRNIGHRATVASKSASKHKTGMHLAAIRNAKGSRSIKGFPKKTQSNHVKAISRPARIKNRKLDLKTDHSGRSLDVSSMSSPAENSTKLDSTTTTEASNSNGENIKEAPATIKKSIPELKKELLENLHQFKSISASLSAQKYLFDKQNKSKKPNQEFTKPKDLTDFSNSTLLLKSSNKILKYFIDNYILTRDVMEKYEAFLKSKPHHKSSTEDVLQFMIRTVTGFNLRQSEKEFLDNSIRYNKLLEKYYSQYVYLPLSNKIIDQFENRILDGTKLTIFIKQYMALVTNVKGNVNFLDYEDNNKLFYPEGLGKSSSVTNKLVYKEGISVRHSKTSKKSELIPIQIIIGNGGHGASNPVKTLPSDIIQSGVDFHPALTHDDLSNLQSNDQKRFVEKEFSRINQSTRKLNTGLIPSDNPAFPELSSQEFDLRDSDTNTGNKLEDRSTLDSKEIETKLEEENKKISRSTSLKNSPTLMYVEPVNPASFRSQSKKNDSLQSQNNVFQTQMLANEATPSAISNKSEEENLFNSFLWNDKKGLPVTPKSIANSEFRKTMETSVNDNLSLRNDNSQQVQGYGQKLTPMPSGLVYDANHLPVNLEIKRVPQIEKVDTKYEDSKYSFGNFDATNYGKIHKSDGDEMKARDEFNNKIKENKPLASKSGDVWADNMRKSQATGQREPSLARSLSMVPQAPSMKRYPSQDFSNKYLGFEPNKGNQRQIFNEQPKDLLEQKTDAIYRNLLRQQI